MSIFIRNGHGLTHSEASGYPVAMWSWRAMGIVLSVVLLQQHLALSFAAVLAEQPESVPIEEYPFYDLVVGAKFLTSHTRLVVIERMTTTGLHPDEPQAPTGASFAERAFFDGRLSRDLVRDFIGKNQRPSRFDARFAFGVRYQFVSGDGVPETEAALSVVPAIWPVQNYEGTLDRIDRLAFSRVGLSLRGDQALLYVANYRPDGTGAGFLVWLARRQAAWDVYDTEVIWTAQIDRGPPNER
ncbi:MAG: hypothetical protein K0S45_3723 [Nitrospira sp.]|nr:hypothetical protein [Nitrospira sp.]